MSAEKVMSEASGNVQVSEKSSKAQTRKILILLGVVLFLVILDQWTKQRVHHGFRLGESLPLIEGILNFTYVRNTGAAFGLLATADPSFRVPFFLLMPVIALVAIGYVFRKLPAEDVRGSTALALVVSGALGNLIDRVVYGFVIDFIDFHWQGQVHFPAFNVADSAICIGVGLLMLDMFQNPEKHGSTPSKT